MEALLFTLFLAPAPEAAARPFRQPDGVVTHPDRPPYHVLAAEVERIAEGEGWQVRRDP